MSDPLPSGGPRPPDEGAYLGAYVQPDTDYTPQGRIDAVTAFEKATGRRLDIVQTFHPWDDEFPDATDKWAVDSGRMLLLSWAGTDTRVIQTGRYDDLIRQRARAIKALGKPIFLRWRWEMDRPNLQASIWTPQDFIAAWRHVRTIFAEEGTTNVSWVWCPTAAGFSDSDRAAPYYPGDSDVDWLCADVYTGQHLDTFSEAAAGFLAWAKGHPRKPIMIGEWATSDLFPGGQTAWLDQAREDRPGQSVDQGPGLFRLERPVEGTPGATGAGRRRGRPIRRFARRPVFQYQAVAGRSLNGCGSPSVRRYTPGTLPSPVDSRGWRTGVQGIRAARTRTLCRG